MRIGRLIGITGGLLALAAALSDVVGLGSPGFGSGQTAGAVVGVALLGLGLWVDRRGNSLEKYVPLAVSVLSGTVLVFVAGVTVGHLGLPPQPLIRDALAAVRDLRENGLAYFSGKPTQHLRPLRFEATGMVVADDPRSQPGVTFLVGLFGNTLGARLYGRDGTLLHEWPFDFFELAPEEMAYEFDALVHGIELFEDGDFIANFDGRGMVRVSACGDVRWRNRARTHHSLFVDEDGFVWAPMYGEAYDETTVLSVPFWVDRIGRFAPEDGRLLETIDLVEVLVDQGAQGVVRMPGSMPNDLLHVNDVEILSTAMADAFPSFQAGDIMLSSRHLNQIWILDGSSHALKWWITGPMIGQHDPDFQPDGSISLFDNRIAGPASEENGFLGELGGSRILRIDPVTRAWDTIYESNDRSTFYSPLRGKHQVLDNGNVLIAETDRGRAFEVMPGGEIVWSFVNAWDEDEVGWMMDAIRYPPSFARIGEIECPAS